MRRRASWSRLAALGAGIRTVRERRGMSQADLAAASGLHRSHLSRIEHGACEPRFETLLKLRHGLGSLAKVLAFTEGEGDQDA
jgi:transcriptional regulator with XRE-family HTH domain